MKRVLVTGGTGSMGQTLVRRLLERDSANEITVLSRDEAKQFDMREEYRGNQRVKFRIGDVRNYDDVSAAMRYADTVIHAAALKQVPSCEYFPGQALLTNCIGMENVVKASSEWGPDTVVTISTDKACKPTTAMGMSKALQEKIWIAANIDNQRTRFIGVRYGNVMSSRGSVIPLFQKQIGAGGPVTITDPAMTRFLLSLDQAANIVFAALADARPGEIYVPRAPSARVGTIVEALVGGRNAIMQVIGPRPGEKKHEIMVSQEESAHVIQRGEYFVIVPQLDGLRHSEDQMYPHVNEYSSDMNVLDFKAVQLLLEAA